MIDGKSEYSGMSIPAKKQKHSKKQPTENQNTKYSRTRLIRHFFVGPGRIPIFFVHFCSSRSSICL